MSRARIRATIIDDRNIEFIINAPPGATVGVAEEFLRRQLKPSEFSKCTDIKIDTYEKHTHRTVGGPSRGKKENFR